MRTTAAKLSSTDMAQILQPFEDMTVLIVDDNESSIALLRATLTMAGLRDVHSVNNSEQAVQRLHDIDPDLVLLDLRMPRVDGYTILAHIRQFESPDLPVLVLTADTTQEATRRALQLGASDFLSKPIDTTEVALRVRNLLQTRALQTRLRQRREWADASGHVARALIASNGADRSQLITDWVQGVSGAEIVVAMIPTSEDPLAIAITSGRLEAPDADRDLMLTQIGESLLRPAITTAQPFAFDDLADADAALDGVLERAGIGAVLVVPFVGTQGVVGAVCLCRDAGRRPFTPVDLDVAIEFCHNTAIALELARASAAQQLLAILEERNRISLDLHDHVLQRLFAIGLHMDALKETDDYADVASSINARIKELDDTIAQIQHTVLNRPGS
jgi:CheY-like chemotaxis protein